MDRIVATLSLLWLVGCRSPLPTSTGADEPEDCRVLTDGESNPLWQSLIDAPYTHPNLPNVSFAGYRYGAELPDHATATRIDVADYGARPDSHIDASDAVDAALAALPAEGGVLFFGTGEYHLSRPIIVQRSHTVLQGAGADETRLVFDRSLTESYAINVDPLGKSRWSWTGGMVWFTPRADRMNVRGADLGASWTEGWSTLDARIEVLGEYERGATSLRVADASGLTPAQLVLIELDTSESLHRHLAGDGAFAATQDWSETGAGAILPPALSTVQWPVSITAIEGDVITLAQPLRFDLRGEWSARLRPIAEVITESGVRDMSIVLARQTTYDASIDHNREVGWNGVLLENALHCFVSHVNVIDSENGVGVVASKNVTLRAFSIQASDSTREAQHHGTVTRLFSNDVLVEDFSITAQPLHGINVEGFSMGNVWSRGVLEHGTWDTHRMLPLENVITELVINNDGTPGGRAGAGPRMGARNATWNVRVTNNECSIVGQPNLMPSGAIVGLQGCTPTDAGNSDCIVSDGDQTPHPTNLYEAQRAARQCAAPL